MTTVTMLDGPALARVVAAYRDVLLLHRDVLNRCNVYPVPDGDTGTNMSLTVDSVCAELTDAADPRGAPSMADVCRGIAHGSLMGARGNSGVILSQALRALSETFAPLDVLTAEVVGAALRRASDAADAAVLRPVEGTILTVIRDSAAASAELLSGEECGLVALLESVLTASRRSVARTPSLLPALAEAGVVDAGGLGFSLLFDAWLHILDGRPLPQADSLPYATAPLIDLGAHAHDDSGLRYEVMFLLEAAADAVPAFKQRWGEVGDSIVVVGGDGEWNCHIHTDDVDAAIAAGNAAGHPSRVQVTDLFEQVQQRYDGARVLSDTASAGGGERADDGRRCVTGVVAVAQGDGVAALLRSLGVREVVAGGQSMNPSTAEILEAVERVVADAVVVLPNNSNVIAVARQAAALSDRDVVVLPTRSVLQGLTALVAYDERGPVGDNASAMEAEVQRVRVGEVTRAVRDASAPVGPIARGDWLGLTDDGIVVVTSSAVEAAVAVAQTLVDPASELITLLVGADATVEEADELCARLGTAHPTVELEVHQGGQPLYPFLLGVE